MFIEHVGIWKQSLNYRPTELNCNQANPLALFAIVEHKICFMEYPEQYFQYDKSEWGQNAL